MSCDSVKVPTRCFVRKPTPFGRFVILAPEAPARDLVHGPGFSTPSVFLLELFLLSFEKRKSQRGFFSPDGEELQPLYLVHTEMGNRKGRERICFQLPPDRNLRIAISVEFKFSKSLLILWWSLLASFGSRRVETCHMH